MRDALGTRGIGQVSDSEAPEVDPVIREIARLRGWRANLGVPFLRDGQPVGLITVGRVEPGAFSEREIGLLQSFADQAAIAMENARLITEQREALERQTATAEVLRIINASPGVLEPVFDVILAKAHDLCGATLGSLQLRDGEYSRAVATRGMDDAFAAFLRRGYPASASITKAVPDDQSIHIADVTELARENQDDPVLRAAIELGRVRTMLSVPLVKDGNFLGRIVAARQEVRPFTDNHIALLEDFAAQAVIAMENTRLLGELTRREEELRVTFDNMGDGVVMFDADLRLASWNRNFQEVLDIPDSFLAARPGLEDYLRLLVERGELVGGDTESIVESYRDRVGRQWSAERTRPDGKVIEVRNNPVPGGGAVLIYSDITERKRAEAAIAAARDAAEAALERQTATADILKVMAGSPTDVQPVLEAVVNAAVRFCGAADATILLRDGDGMISRAHEGPLSYNAGDRRPLGRGAAGGRAIVDGLTCHLPDAETLDPVEFASARRLATLHGFRSIVAAPLKREDAAIGAVVLRKVEAGPFTPQQIELLETFAAQAVIAIENVRLFTELRDSLERLKAAQANLIQAEKMASLGQLTAGIAHEIKNPLNFVNNFADLSVGLLGELKEAAAPALATLDAGTRAEVDEVVDMLTGNLEKIAEHGRRADSIVKGMLAHSRGGTGQRQSADVNALVEESLNLAFHGARAQDQNFNITLERDLDPAIGSIELVPQDITRVFLNLCSNGFYAASKRQCEAGEADYRPLLKVATRELGDAVEVRIRDNGIGVPPEIRDKLFQPFFTTKPTGEGTGLGLSISYDIVTQQHGGTIAVDSEPGSFTEFTIRLPRRGRVTTAERA
jgi:signal transduction histidine kinase/PAS domain-containing protein